MNLYAGYFSMMLGMDPMGLDWFDNISNFCAGVADALTLDLTKYSRKGYGTDKWVNKESTSYSSGGITGDAGGLLLGGAGIAKIIIKNKIKKAILKKGIGNTFIKSNQLYKLQIGVNPRSLTPGKNLKNLKKINIKNAVKNAGDQSIEVSIKGVIQDGNHRIKNAIDVGKAVDTIITVP